MLTFFGPLVPTERYAIRLKAPVWVIDPAGVPVGDPSMFIHPSSVGSSFYVSKVLY